LGVIAHSTPPPATQPLWVIAFYLHLGVFAQFLVKNLDQQIQAIDEEAARQPRLLKVAQPA
jgi:hypothetical protein